MVSINTIQFGSYLVGAESPVIIIAELGINHNGQVSIGKELIDAAVESGVNIVKFQTYITEKRFNPGNPFVGIFKKMELSREDEAELWDYARSREIGVMSSPFDPESAAFCAEMKVDGFKIASFETTNKSLLRSVLEHKLPMLVSCGQNTEREVDGVVELIQSYDCPYALLHCISSYPMKDSDANLAVIPKMLKKYNCPIGFSDHSEGARIAGYAVAAGARIIEKHFTIDNSMEGPDHAMSANPSVMTNTVRFVREMESIMGTSKMEIRPCEKTIFDMCRRETN